MSDKLKKVSGIVGVAPAGAKYGPWSDDDHYEDDVFSGLRAYAERRVFSVRLRRVELTSIFGAFFRLLFGCFSLCGCAAVRNFPCSPAVVFVSYEQNRTIYTSQARDPSNESAPLPIHISSFPCLTVPHTNPELRDPNHFFNQCCTEETMSSRAVSPARFSIVPSLQRYSPYIPPRDPLPPNPTLGFLKKTKTRHHPDYSTAHLAAMFPVSSPSNTQYTELLNRGWACESILNNRY